MVDFEHDLGQAATMTGIGGRPTRSRGSCEKQASRSSAPCCLVPHSGMTGRSFPFSLTGWTMRPLGVQILALAYRSGEALERNRVLPTMSSIQNSTRRSFDFRCRQTFARPPWKTSKRSFKGQVSSSSPTGARSLPISSRRSKTITLIRFSGISARKGVARVLKSQQAHRVDVTGSNHHRPRDRCRRQFLANGSGASMAATKRA